MEGTKIYLDYNSTTPLEPEVLSSITEALTTCYANPSSSHEEGVAIVFVLQAVLYEFLGVKAKRCIEKARSHVAAMIRAKDSGMSLCECSKFAYQGVSRAYKLWEICDRTVKVLTENFYCSIASIKLLRVLSLKFCLTLDRFGSKHQRNVVA